MSFIGIVTDQKSENSLKTQIAKTELEKKANILFITDKNIDNIKNIKFETIVLNKALEKQETLKKILINAKNLIINTDIENEIEILEKLNVTIITYGFNSKSTITASSVEEEEALICLQRSLQNKEKETIDPQEIKVKITKNGNIYDSMIITAIELFYLK